jgi:2-succinyl-5-enolpyruvyl-6-hydroxy-3-cyclohexene-1-carboxylate synthase
MTRSRSSSPATDFSLALFDEYLALGLRDVVVSPGSRSQALALVAAEYERRGLLRLRVRIDERVGGFLALGLAVETATPVLIITTSGTAVANLHPAVLEAHHSGVPLIVLSADRPAELRGIGSNQTANQTGIFGAAITRAWEVEAPRGDSGEVDAAAALARESWGAALRGHHGRPTPVHMNIGFREPLSGAIVDGPEDAGTATSTIDREAPESPFEEHVLHRSPGTVVVAGAGAGEQAEAVARALGVPLFAEVSSGAHFGPNLVVTYRQLLKTEGFGNRIARVIVFGHPTLSREIPALIMREDVTTTVVRTPGADDYNPGHRVVDFVDAVRVAAPAEESGTVAVPETAAPAEPESPAEARAWLGSWVFASRALLEPAAEEFPVDLSNAEFARRQLAIVRAPVTRPALAEAVWQTTWPHDRLVLGASRLIREVDQIVTGKRIRVHANRGLAGIDGTIATSIGIALASQAEPSSPVESSPGTSAATSPRSASGTTRVLLGDVTALHDVGALLFGAGEPQPRIQVIVGNDGGGTIFDGLEVAGSTAAEALDRVMFTAQSVDFEKLAAAYGWIYLRVSTIGELDEALAACPGPMLIEVLLAR